MIDSQTVREYLDTHRNVLWAMTLQNSKPDVDLQDLFQLGCVRVAMAVRTFREEFGVPFSTYATTAFFHGLRGKSSIRTQRPFCVPREKDWSFPILTFVANKLWQSLERDPTAEEILQALQEREAHRVEKERKENPRKTIHLQNWTIDNVRNFLDLYPLLISESLEKPVRDDGTVLGSFLTRDDEGVLSPEEIIDLAREHEALERRIAAIDRCIGSLKNKRHVFLLRARTGIGRADGEAMSQSQIATVWNCYRQNVSEMEKRVSPLFIKALQATDPDIRTIQDISILVQKRNAIEHILSSVGRLPYQRHHAVEGSAWTA